MFLRWSLPRSSTVIGQTTRTQLDAPLARPGARAPPAGPRRPAARPAGVSAPARTYSADVRHAPGAGGERPPPRTAAVGVRAGERDEEVPWRGRPGVDHDARRAAALGAAARHKARPGGRGDALCPQSSRERRQLGAGHLRVGRRGACGHRRTLALSVALAGDHDTSPSLACEIATRDRGPAGPTNRVDGGAGRPASRRGSPRRSRPLLGARVVRR